MKHLKLFESFDTFRLDEITRKKFVDIHRNREEMEINRKSLKMIKLKIPKDYTLSYGGSWFTIHRCDESKSNIEFKKISVDKVSQGGDEPFYTLQYFYEISKGGKVDDGYHFFVFEESDFNKMCENPEILLDYLDKKNMIRESLFSEIPDPEPMDVNEWDREVTDAEEIPFNQKEKELFIALSDTISVKNKRYTEVGKYSLFFQLINGDLNQRLRDTTPIRNISTYKNDDEFYYVNIWGRDDDDKLYRCDGYECWEKFLKEIFTGYRDLINNQTKTNESYFDEAAEPKSLLDENGDYIPGSSRASMNNREPFNQKEKSFINQLLETLNEEYISTNFSDNTEFALNMGEMGETTHGMRVVKLTDDYYEVQYNNFVDSDDEYIYCECDGFKCLSKLLIRLFEKINKDYDYEGD